MLAKKGASMSSQIDKVVGVARQEIAQLTGEKQSLNAEDIVKLRSHAKARTNLSSSDDDLTVEQKVWKTLYYQFDDDLDKLLGPDKKAELDQLEQRREDLTELARALEEKLQKDGDDSAKGKITLLLFSILGGILHSGYGVGPS